MMFLSVKELWEFVPFATIGRVTEVLNTLSRNASSRLYELEVVQKFL